MKKIIFSFLFLIFLCCNLFAQDVQTYFDLGLKEMEAKNFSEAVDYFTKALSIKEDGAIYYNRGVCYGQLGEFQKADYDFSKTIETNPEFADAYNGRGLARYSLLSYESAIIDFSKAIELTPLNADAYFNRGKVYKELGEYNNAIYDFSKVVLINIKHSFAYYERGFVYYYKKDYFNSCRDWSIAISINPDFEKELKSFMDKCK
jgi:tetratricopeptide (TPR) repeat protein